MIREFNLIIIFIFLIYIINSYYLSVKRNIIKLTSFLLRIITSWVLSNLLASSIFKINISSDSYEYKINGEVIYNINDVLRVLIIKNFPELSFIVNERLASKYIIDSVSILIIKTVLIVLIYILITMIYKVTMNIIKIYRKKRQKPEEIISKKSGLIYGALQGFLVVFLVSIPFSGISSITNDYLELEEKTELSKELTFLKDYRNTISGKVFNVVNINKKPIDIFLFDEVFALKLNNKTIHPSIEVGVYVDIYKMLEGREVKELGLTSINRLEEKEINMLISKLKEAESLNIFLPLLIDYFLLNEYEINLDAGLYEVDYYNELSQIGELLILYINDYENIDFSSLRKVDKVTISKALNLLSELDLLDKLSSNINDEILNHEKLNEFLYTNELETINLDNVNYKKEITIIRKIFDKVFEINNQYNDEVIYELVKLVSSSNILMDNQRLLLEFLITNNLDEYNSEIKRYDINEDDINSLIVIAKAYIDNGYTESHFNFSKLYDDATIDILIDAICSSNLLKNNLGVIIRLFLKESKFNIDFPFYIPEDLDFSIPEGKKELRELLRLFRIMNLGINQENIEKNLDEICLILESSYMIRSNINRIISWGLEKYNTSQYEIYIEDIDFNSPEGEIEIKSLIKVLRLLVSKKALDGDISVVLGFSKEELDIVFNSKLIEEAAIHFLHTMGKDENNPLIVNLELGDEAWYKNNKNNGELRQFVYAIKLIFKDVEDINDIKFTPELILSIDDGTIDTNGDGIVDHRDENELFEIMKSKILSDTIIKFIYDYYKNLNK